MTCPGPAPRIGPVAGGVAELARGTRVVLTPDDVDGTSERLPVAWAGFAVVDEGDVCYLADGAVRLRVSSVTGADVVTNVEEVGGSVASRQGLNLPNVTVSLPAVSDEDIALIDAGIDMGVDYFALSFVRRREDLEPVRAHLRSRGSSIPLIAKIEKPQAAANSEEIVDAADGIMVARGDLGIELPIEEVPLVQKRLLRPGRTAGQARDHGHPDARAGRCTRALRAARLRPPGRPCRSARSPPASRPCGAAASCGASAPPRCARHDVTQELIADAARRVVELGWCRAGQRVGITAGLPSGRPGTTSMFQVQVLDDPGRSGYAQFARRDDAAS